MARAIFSFVPPRLSPFFSSLFFGRNVPLYGVDHGNDPLVRPPCSGLFEVPVQHEFDGFKLAVGARAADAENIRVQGDRLAAPLVCGFHQDEVGAVLLKREIVGVALVVGDVKAEEMDFGF